MKWLGLKIKAGDTITITRIRLGKADYPKTIQLSVLKTENAHMEVILWPKNKKRRLFSK